MFTSGTTTLLQRGDIALGMVRAVGANEMKRHQSKWICVLALSAAAVACGNEFSAFETEGEGGATADSSGNSGPVCVDFGDSCSACEAAACEPTFCECYGNADCGLYASCAFACEEGDFACLQQCNTAHPDGITDAVLLNDCAHDNCAAECGEYPLIELTTCERCTYESCEPQMNTCLANADCTQLVFCFQACGTDTSCQNTCSATYPAGLADAAPVAACAQTSCSAPCYGGG